VGLRKPVSKTTMSEAEANRTVVQIEASGPYGGPPAVMKGEESDGHLGFQRKNPQLNSHHTISWIKRHCEKSLGRKPPEGPPRGGENAGGTDGCEVWVAVGNWS